MVFAKTYAGFCCKIAHIFKRFAVYYGEICKNILKFLGKMLKLSYLILGGAKMEVLKVSSKSSPNAVAGALSGVIREKGVAEIQAIGAGAINQAIKSIAVARGFLAPSGIELICIPAFTEINIDGEERTAIKLVVEPR